MVLFLVGFVLGLIFAFWGDILPNFIPGIEGKEANSWILNLFIGSINGLITIISYITYGISFEFFISLIVSGLFFTIYISDFKYMIILDSPLIISSIITFFLRVVYYGWKNAFISLLAGLLLFGLMYLISIIGKIIFKREALGGGDIKLAFVIGIILNIRHGLMAIILSSLLALPYAIASIILNRIREIPFGPFIISSLVLVFIFYDKFLNLISLF